MITKGPKATTRRVYTASYFANPLGQFFISPGFVQLNNAMRDAKYSVLCKQNNSGSKRVVDRYSRVRINIRINIISRCKLHHFRRRVAFLQICNVEWRLRFERIASSRYDV